MTNSPTPNPNRRRRLTADELIAIFVAMAGIGTVFFWGIGQKNSPLNSLVSSGTAALTGNASSNHPGLLNREANSGEHQTIVSMGERERGTPPNPASQSPAPTVVTTTTQTTEAPQATAPAVVAVPVVPVAPVVVTPAITPSPTPLPIVKAPTFTDVPKQFWGAGYIAELGKRGILDDFGAGKFDPSKPITRGEYAKMLDRAFADKPVTRTSFAFEDIPGNYPRKEAVDGAVTRGFMTGYSAKKFAPNQPIPRYQLQISLAKGLGLPIQSSQDKDKLLSKFEDAAQMPKYAREKMAAAVAAGLTIKDQATNQLKPVQDATRADAAALIYEALVKEGKIQGQLNP